MQKDVQLWEIDELRDRIHQISFPEYQRESTVWRRNAKQRLIDSIIRGFDIAAIYLCANGEGAFECIDGQQRISAIISFLSEEDNNFPFKVMNEIYGDAGMPFEQLDGKSFSQIKEERDATSQKFVRTFLNYKLTVVVLADNLKAEEFNLQFARLNLGVIINSGEKLNAMVGELRDACFDLAKNPFFESRIRIPARRFAHEQLAAQIVAQVFAVEQAKTAGYPREFARVRHLDLQKLFKDNIQLNPQEKKWISGVKKVLALLAKCSFPDLRRRSIVLSIVLLAYEKSISTLEDAQKLANFAQAFLDRLNEQVGKAASGDGVDEKYRYLLEFQKHLTQGLSEKPAIGARAECLEQSYDYWISNDQLPSGKDIET